MFQLLFLVLVPSAGDSRMGRHPDFALSNGDLKLVFAIDPLPAHPISFKNQRSYAPQSAAST